MLITLASWWVPAIVIALISEALNIWQSQRLKLRYKNRFTSSRYGNIRFDHLKAEWDLTKSALVKLEIGCLMCTKVLFYLSITLAVIFYLLNLLSIKNHSLIQ
jgi:hypothetical protein